LYYPYVSSCVTVTLVFENGLLGGHASQVAAEETSQAAAEEKGGFRQALNLQEVIGRMKAEDSGGGTRGALRRIYFVGLVEVEQWNFDRAVKVIAEHFGQPKVEEPFKYNRSPAEVVFDGTDGKLYMLQSGLVEATNVTEMVGLIKQLGDSSSYYG
jgi:hypothetical protein